MRSENKGFLFVLPAVILLTVLMVYPLLQTISYAFTSFKLAGGDVIFVGLKNFRDVMKRYEFIHVLRNTISWVIATVTLQFAIAMMVALFLNIKFVGREVIQIIALIPWTIPSVVSGNTWKWIFQTDYGLINSTLRALGLSQFTRPWLSEPRLAFFSVLFAAIWQGYPFLMVMLLSGLKGIPEEQHEAAMIDGANTFHRFRYITLPNLQNIIVIVLTLQVIYAWNTFDIIFVMTGGGPGGATEILGLFIYKLGFSSFNFSQAAAVSVILLLFIFIVLGIRNIASISRGTKHA
ncbi:MAG: sugar ABC transporter permease [Sphaerochaeta sp.]|jgi:multiple sugar transport system permease protein